MQLRRPPVESVQQGIKQTVHQRNEHKYDSAVEEGEGSGGQSQDTKPQVQALALDHICVVDLGTRRHISLILGMI